MALTRPAVIVKPFAESGDKNVIPLESLVGITPGAPSLETGFPPLTSVDPNLGGVPVKRADFNGIFNLVTQHNRFVSAGGQPIFDAALCAEIGGYPVGTILQDNAGVNSYINILAGNTTNFNTTPESIGVSWIAYSGPHTASLSVNGYQKIPGGLILQWGRVASDVASNTSITWTYPITFPTSFLHAFVTHYNNGVPAEKTTINVLTFSTTALTYNLSAGGLQSAALLAIGY